MSYLFKLIYLIISVVVLFSTTLSAQDVDTAVVEKSYIHHKKRLILGLSTGFNSANASFNLKYNDLGKFNMVFNSPFLMQAAVGYADWWVGWTFQLPISTLSKEKYGESKYMDFNAAFTYKKVNFRIELQSYTGFVFLNQRDKDTAFIATKHGYHPDFRTTSLSLNSRYFFKEDFHYKSALGLFGEYKENAWSPYVYGYLGGISVFNDGDYLLPDFARTESIGNSNSIRMNAIDVGLIPGMAFVYRKNWFQATALVGFGPLIQVKNFRTPNNNRGYLGLSNRTDLQLIFGIQKDIWFLQFMTEFKFRRINIRAINFQEYFYDVRLVGGYRFPERTIKLKKPLF